MLVGRWSTIFLRGIGHAVRVRICAPPAARAQRVMERHRIGSAEALQRIAAYDDGVRARMRQMFDVDWTDPLLYDLVINTERIGVMTAVEQVLALVASSEFQPTLASRQMLADRALAARVRAIVKATPATSQVDVDVQAAEGHVRLAGLVGSEAEREDVLAVAREVPGRGAGLERRQGLQEAGPVNWAEVATAEFWFRWIQIVILDLTLAGDNALVIALAVRKLPARQQWQGRLWGTMGAVGLRIVFIAIISVLLRIPLLQAAGGAILLWIAVKLLSQEGHGGEEHETVRQGTTLLEAIWIIVLADVIMSLDNVLAISGAAHGDMVLVVFGVGLSIPLVIWGSGLLARLMARFWWIVDVGAAILGWVAGEMILGDQRRPGLARWAPEHRGHARRPVRPRADGHRRRPRVGASPRARGRPGARRVRSLTREAADGAAPFRCRVAEPRARP